jgi:hypothetical protein
MKAPLQVLPGLAVAAGLALTGVLRAVELPSMSPFLPVGAAPAAQVVAPDAGALELRGVIPTPFGPLFSIYNTTRRKSTLVGLNETGTWGSGVGGTFVVRSHRQIGDQDQVTIEFQGRSSTVVSKKSRVGVVARGGTNLPTPPGGAPATVTQSVTLNPTPESEARRLQDTVDEINRRRTLRAQGGDAAPAAPAARGTP